METVLNWATHYTTVLYYHSNRFCCVFLHTGQCLCRALIRAIPVPLSPPPPYPPLHVQQILSCPLAVCVCGVCA